MFKIISFFIITLFSQLYVKVGIMFIKLALSRHLSLTYLCQPRKVNVALGLPILPLFTTLIIEFGTVPTVWYVLVFISLASKLQSSLFPSIRALSINSRTTKNIKYYNILFAHIKYGHANRVFPCFCHQY